MSGITHDTIARAALVAVVLVLVIAAPASAHPLGNFSVNHLSTVSISSDRVEVRYVLDQAEIPTVQERGLARAEVLRRKLDEVGRGLVLTVDGRRAGLRTVGQPRLSFPMGAGGLPTTRVEVTLAAAVRDPKRVGLHDGTFPDRIGWKAIVAAPGDHTAVRTKAPSGDPTDGLRTYPTDLLKSPLDQRDASFSVTPGNGSLVAPKGMGGHPVATGEPRSDGLTALFEDAAAGRGVLVLLLLGAFGWGALHALSPGHGKAMVAAYLVGTRGSVRDAVVLGGTVTLTHTIGVFALGLVTLALSQYVLPEQLYPWLTLASGLMVVGVGAGVLRSRLRSSREHGHAHGITGMGTSTSRRAGSSAWGPPPGFFPVRPPSSCCWPPSRSTRSRSGCSSSSPSASASPARSPGSARPSSTRGGSCRRASPPAGSLPSCRPRRR